MVPRGVPGGLDCPVMALHPVGPLPATTYWLRRAVLLVPVVLVLLLARSCLGGDSPQPSATPTVTPSATSTPTAGTPPTTAPVASAVCDDTAVRLETTTDQSTYPVGGKPKITLTVRNTSAVACTRDLGSGAVELLVYSGDERIWSSDDCGTGRGSSVVTLAPGAQKFVDLTWAGKRSKPQCAGTKEQAKPGTYRVVGRAGTLRTEGAIFRFRVS